MVNSIRHGTADSELLCLARMQMAAGRIGALGTLTVHTGMQDSLSSPDKQAQHMRISVRPTQLHTAGQSGYDGPYRETAR